MDISIIQRYEENINILYFLEYPRWFDFFWFAILLLIQKSSGYDVHQWYELNPNLPKDSRRFSKSEYQQYILPKGKLWRPISRGWSPQMLVSIKGIIPKMPEKFRFWNYPNLPRSLFFFNGSKKHSFLHSKQISKNWSPGSHRSKS